MLTQQYIVDEDQWRKMLLFDRQASWPDTKTVVEKADTQKVRNADSAVHCRPRKIHSSARIYQCLRLQGK